MGSDNTPKKLSKHVKLKVLPLYWKIGKSTENLSFNVSRMENSQPRKSITMKILLKWGLRGGFAVILLFAIVLSTITLNEAKDTIIEKISAESGMKIEIESIGFGFSQGLKIKCRGVKVATPDGETYAVAQLNLLPKWALLLGKLKIDSTVFDLENISLPVEITGKTVNLEISQIKGNASLNDNKLNQNISAKILGGNISAKSNLSLKNTGAPHAIKTDLQLEHIDLARIQHLKKGDWIPTSGKLTGKIKIKGALPKENVFLINLRPEGILNINKLALGTGEKKKTIEAAKLIVKDNSKKFTQGLIELDKVRTAGLQLKKVQTKFKINPKQIDLNEGRIFLKNGQLKLTGSFLSLSSDYRLRFQGNKLKIEDFLEQLTGSLNMQGKLNGKLHENSIEFRDMAKELSGQVKIKLTDGTLPEFKALETFLTLLNPLTGQQSKKAGLNYESLEGDFKIVKGLINTENLEMKSPQIKLQVTGEANLATDTINAQVKAMPSQMLDKTIKAIPFLGNILTGGKKGGVIETYFKVDGKLSSPKVTAQLHKSR